MLRRILIGSAILCILIPSLALSLQLGIRVGHDYVPVVGMKAEYSMITLMGSMEETGISVGEQGDGQVFDISAWKLVGPSVATTTMGLSALAPDRVPEAADFPEADYALRFEIQYPPQLMEGQTYQNCSFMKVGEHLDEELESTNAQMALLELTFIRY